MNLPRREFLKLGAATLALASLPGSKARAKESARIYKAVKLNMFKEKIPLAEKFRLLREYGFDGVELDAPGVFDLKEARRASLEADLPIHGVVDAIHWKTRLSDPDPVVRAKAVAGLGRAIVEAHELGATSVLLVPGKVTDPENENQDQVWDRSITGIREVLPLAARLGVRILIENVWNGFCYTHDGPDNQTADLLAKYIDAIASPWVGVYFDIGNHQKYGKPEAWIRTLGPRIVKLDVKDWGKKTGFSKLGDGDVNWPAVRAALKEIHFTGWATAEVSGGKRNRMREIAHRFTQTLKS